MAAELWQQWLRFVAAAEGRETARAQAEAAGWPPLLDWFDLELPKEGGKTDA